MILGGEKIGLLWQARQVLVRAVIGTDIDIQDAQAQGLTPRRRALGVGDGHLDVVELLDIAITHGHIEVDYEILRRQPGRLQFDTLDLGCLGIDGRPRRTLGVGVNHNGGELAVGVVGAEYRTIEEPPLTIDVYPARIFEFLRDRMVSLHRQNAYINLYTALRISIQKLISDHPGDYAFFLANESVLFAFCNFRKFMVFKESETMGDVLLITSIEEGLSDSKWQPIVPDEESQGELLVIAGPDVLYAGEV